jgi:hypothetical protein
MRKLFLRAGKFFIVYCFLTAGVGLLAMDTLQNVQKLSEFDLGVAFLRGLERKYHKKSIEIWKNDPLVQEWSKRGMQYASLRNYCRWRAIAETEIPQGVIIDGRRLQIYIANKEYTPDISKQVAQKPILLGEIKHYNLKQYVDAISCYGIGKKYAKYEDAIEEINEQKKTILPTLVKNYKIHLMPMEKNDYDTQAIEKIWIKLLQLIKNKQELSQLISLIKIITTSYSQIHQIQMSQKEPAIPPRIAIYIYGGTMIAQKVLQIIYDEFKDLQGSNVQPGYNEQVTSLLFFAQGDRDCKGDEYAKYYEPGRVYYDPFITGKKAEYHLVNPKAVGSSLSSSTTVTPSLDSTSTKESLESSDLPVSLSEKIKGRGRKRKRDAIFD